MPEALDSTTVIDEDVVKPPRATEEPGNDVDATQAFVKSMLANFDDGTPKGIHPLSSAEPIKASTES